jgi:thiamine-monophosphate kinase
VASAVGREPSAFAAGAGDDYELLVCAPPKSSVALERAAHEAGTRLTWLGEVGGGAGLELIGPGGEPAEQLRGYEHP